VSQVTRSWPHDANKKCGYDMVINQRSPCEGIRRLAVATGHGTEGTSVEAGDADAV